jgi:hypothetical protein
MSIFGEGIKPLIWGYQQRDVVGMGIIINKRRTSIHCLIGFIQTSTNYGGNFLFLPLLELDMVQRLSPESMPCVIESWLPHVCPLASWVAAMDSGDAGAECISGISKHRYKL